MRHVALLCAALLMVTAGCASHKKSVQTIENYHVTDSTTCRRQRSAILLSLDSLTRHTAVVLDSVTVTTDSAGKVMHARRITVRARTARVSAQSAIGNEECQALSTVKEERATAATVTETATRRSTAVLWPLAVALTLFIYTLIIIRRNGK